MEWIKPRFVLSETAFKWSGNGQQPWMASADDNPYSVGGGHGWPERNFRKPWLKATVCGKPGGFGVVAAFLCVDGNSRLFRMPRATAWRQRLPVGFPRVRSAALSGRNFV